MIAVTGTIAERVNLYMKLMGAAVICVDEVRAMEGMPSPEDAGKIKLDTFLLSRYSQFIPQQLNGPVAQTG